MHSRPVQVSRYIFKIAMFEALGLYLTPIFQGCGMCVCEGAQYCDKILEKVWFKCGELASRLFLKLEESSLSLRSLPNSSSYKL